MTTRMIGTSVKIGREGWTPLMDASYKGEYEKADFLLRLNVDVNAKEMSAGYTPLMCASMKGDTLVIRSLLEKGANVSAKNFWGMTALNLAEECGHNKVVDLLKKAGAMEQ